MLILNAEQKISGEKVDTCLPTCGGWKAEST